MSEQVVIDSLDFARKAEVLRGQVEVAKLARLQDALYANDGVLDYVLSGSLNAHGKPVLRCEVKGVLHLRCQRCMQRMEFLLESCSDLLLAADEDELARYDEAGEASSEAILADAHLDVVALVEDEALLALPMAPMHPMVECSENPQLKGRADSPFKVLAALKSTGQTGQ